VVDERGAAGSSPVIHDRSRSDRMVLKRYYEHLDGPRPAEGLELATPDVRFLIAMPGRTIEGGDRGDLADYIARRDSAGKGRVHDVMASAVQGSLEFHYGVVREHGTTMGVMLSAVHTTPDGRFDRYLNLFQTSVALLH
jgi:hypothetical protein